MCVCAGVQVVRCGLALAGRLAYLRGLERFWGRDELSGCDSLAVITCYEALKSPLRYYRLISLNDCNAVLTP